MPETTPSLSAPPALDLFGVCLKAHRLLYLNKEEVAAIPGFAELYDDIHAAIEDAISH